MIKRALLLGIVAAPAVLMAVDNVTVQASATILPALTLDELVPLNFGRVVAPPAPAAAGGPAAPQPRVILNANGGAPVFENGTANGGGGLATTARFRVTAPAGTRFTVENILPFDITHTTIGGNVMRVTVHEVQSDHGGPAVVLAGNNHTVQAGGTEEFTLGARLAVAPGQRPGLYQGNYRVTVTYH